MTPAAVAVLGGGTAGVVAAAHLARTGSCRVDLIEAGDRLGGLHHSPLVHGVPFDIGAFVFTPEHEYFRTFPTLTSKFVRVLHRGAVVRDRGAIDVYPLSFSGYLRDRGKTKLALDLIDLARCKWVDRKRESFPAHCRYYLGGRIYEHSGLRAYVERLYAMPDSQIGLELARGRLAALAEGCALRPYAARFVESLRDPRPAPSWNCFVRPPGGFQEVYETIRDELESLGVRVVLGAHLQRITPNASGHRVEFDGQTRDYDRVISTIPMESAAAACGIRLPFVPPTMKLASLFYRFDGRLGFEADCLSNYSSDGDWKRLTVLSNYYGRLDGDHAFTVECTVPEEDGVSLDSRRRDFESHVARWPIFRGRLKYVGGCVTPRAYPVFRRADEPALKQSRAALQSTNLVFTGRQGKFQYQSSAAVARESRDLVAGVHPR